jgi:hypothetical protein
MDVDTSLFVVLNETLQHHDHAAIDVPTKLRIVGKLPASFDQKSSQMLMKDRVRATDALFEKAAKAVHLREFSETPSASESRFSSLAVNSERSRDFLDE